MDTREAVDRSGHWGTELQCGQIEGRASTHAQRSCALEVGLSERRFGAERGTLSV